MQDFWGAPITTLAELPVRASSGYAGRPKQLLQGFDAGFLGRTDTHARRPARARIVGVHRAPKAAITGVRFYGFWGAPIITLTELPVRASSGTV